MPASSGAGAPAKAEPTTTFFFLNDYSRKLAAQRSDRSCERLSLLCVDRSARLPGRAAVEISSSLGLYLPSRNMGAHERLSF